MLIGRFQIFYACDVVENILWDLGFRRGSISGPLQILNPWILRSLVGPQRTTRRHFFKVTSRSLLWALQKQVQNLCWVKSVGSKFMDEKGPLYYFSMIHSNASRKPWLFENVWKHFPEHAALEMPLWSLNPCWPFPLLAYTCHSWGIPCHRLCIVAGVYVTVLCYHLDIGTFLGSLFQTLPWLQPPQIYKKKQSVCFVHTHVTTAFGFNALLALIDISFPQSLLKSRVCCIF